MSQINFQIDIINVSAPTFTKTPKGGYNQIEVTFHRMVDGKKKLDGKKLIDFKFPEVYGLVKSLKGGEKLKITAEKNDGEKFWNWINAEVATAGSTEIPAQNDTGNQESSIGVSVAGTGEHNGDQKTGSTRGRVTGSNYETSAERAARQIYIVRQSSVSAAIELLKASGDPFDTGNVIEVARQFESYVFEKSPKPDSDIPF